MSVGPDAAERDQARTARLLFDGELAAGTLAPDALQSASVRSATRVRSVPVRALRVAEQLRYKLGGLDFESGVVTPLLAARRATLGDSGAAEPRFIIRVDEFPHYLAWDQPERYGTAAYERFYEIMAGARLPYLLAVLPRVSRQPLSPAAHGSRPLDDEELTMLRRLSAEGVAVALHGRDHRTRSASPRRHSEMCGLSHAQTEELLTDALGELAPHGIDPWVFVPPYNRFDAEQLELLARRFQVICGGPESIGTLGFHRSPQWRGQAVYLPSYAPLYGTAAQVLPAVERAIERRDGLWLPVVLHWGWELDAGWGELERLVERIAPYAASWQDFHDAIERSSGDAPGEEAPAVGAPAQ
jgi:peptidoglycan/xylan/chitin deacetylase (PgdA/CDA1 family)